jgi:hypothetical protein
LLLVVAPDLEQVHQPFVLAGDGLELLDAGELALERAVVLEVPAPDNFHRAISAEGITRQPHFAVAAPADAPQQFVIGNVGLRLRGESKGLRARTVLAVSADRILRAGS